MSAAILASVSAIVGVVLGQLFSRSADGTKWHRQELYQALTDFLAAVEDFRIEELAANLAERQLNRARMATASELRSDNLQRIIKQKMMEQLGREPSDSELVDVLPELEGVLHGKNQTSLGYNIERRLTSQREGGRRVNVARLKVELLATSEVAVAAAALQNAALAYTGMSEDDEFRILEGYTKARNAFASLARSNLRQPVTRRKLSRGGNDMPTLSE